MAAPETPLTPYLSAQHFLGAELRHRRVAAGLSQRALAERLFVSWATVGKVELGQRYPTLDLTQRCDELLHAGGVLVRLHGLVEAERAAQARTALAPTTGVDQERAAALVGQIVKAALRQLPTQTTAGVLARIDSALLADAAHTRPAQTPWR